MADALGSQAELLTSPAIHALTFLLCSFLSRLLSGQEVTGQLMVAQNFTLPHTIKAMASGTGCPLPEDQLCTQLVAG